MKIIRLFLFAALLYSCNGTSQPKEEVKAIDENLQIKTKTTLTHTYTKSGLLDSSYKTQSFYLKGKFALALNSIIKRDYDSKNNLLTEKTFDDSQTNYLSEEKTFSYDAKNNLISEIDKLDWGTRSIIIKYYNEHNQETKRIEIQNIQDYNPDGSINSQSSPQYDTSIKVNFYDPQGNLIKQKSSNSNNVVQFTLLTFYSNGQKGFSCELDENSDTLTTFKYKNVGNLIEEKAVPKSDPKSYLITLYDGNKKIKTVFYDSNINKKYIETFKYDEKGNEVEHISYE
jgi:hypothetical protein